MKILFLNSVYDFGSTGKILRVLNDSLVSDKVETRIIYGRKKQKNQNNVMFLNSKMNLADDVIKSLTRCNHGLNSRNNTLKIIEYISEFKPDIVHIHNLHGFYINYEMLLEHLIINNLKVVMTLHDCWMLTGFCAHFDYNKCVNWESGCKVCNFKNTYPYKIFNSRKQIECNYNLKLRLLSDLDVTFVVPSKWLKGKVEQTLLVSKDIHVVNNGISLADFKCLNTRKQKMVLGISNVWTVQKGLKDWNKLAEILPAEYDIVMYGLTKKQAKNMHPRIIARPRTNNVEELVSAYNSAEVFVNMTYEDTFPTVNIEAIACGLPVVSYDTGGCEETILECGILTSKGNVQGIVDAINMLDTKSEDRFRFAKVAKNAFSMKKMYKEYKEIYDMLIFKK